MNGARRPFSEGGPKPFTFPGAGIAPIIAGPAALRAGHTTRKLEATGGRFLAS